LIRIRQYDSSMKSKSHRIKHRIMICHYIERLVQIINLVFHVPSTTTLLFICLWCINNNFQLFIEQRHLFIDYFLILNQDDVRTLRWPCTCLLFSAFEPALCTSYIHQYYRVVILSYTSISSHYIIAMHTRNMNGTSLDKRTTIQIVQFALACIIPSIVFSVQQ
jgi:hypothetical protein